MVESSENGLAVIVNGKDQDRRTWADEAELAGQMHAAEIGEIDIQHEGVRVVPGGKAQRVGPGRAFGSDPEVIGGV